MPLAPGTRLGAYEVLSLIGAGGMGEVYRALDTKLNRDVALKILPESFAHDPDRLARFKREAQVLASLNHPNIAAIYGFEESGGVCALVLELVEGPTLGDSIAQGPIPLDDALPIAKQIADALEAAHEQGIIHRDLKPSNIKLRPDGTVKVLDFGLAKALDPSSSATDVSQAPTITSPAMTGMGVILGTAAYMSPEQAKGKAVDRRTDIWAFGCVLYEMLTGKRAFGGNDATEIIAAVVRGEPDWSVLPTSTPAKLRDLLQRCMEKDPKQRLRDIGDARIEIADVSNDPGVLTETTPLRRWRALLPWATAVSMTVIATAAVVWSTTRSSAAPTLPAHLVISLPPDAPVAIDTDRPAIAVSPDGSRLVYVANQHGKRMLYARRLDDLEVKPILGTDGAAGPFFSPDGEWVGFFVGMTMKKIRYDGGAPVTFTESTPVSRGASWGSDNNIIFTSNPNGSFLQQPATGGPWVELLPEPDPKTGGRSHSWPELLPSARIVLFALDVGGSFDTARVAAMTLATKEKKVLIDGGTNPHYSPSGHLLYARSGSLFVTPFDRERLEVRGAPVRLIDGVMMESDGAAHVALSQNGVLAYLAGPVQSAERALLWVDRAGIVRSLVDRTAPFLFPALSPDGRRLAVTIEDGSNTDVWVLDLERGTLMRLTSHPGEDFGPVWSPDGNRIAFASEMLGGGPNLAWVPANGSGQPEILLPGPRGPRDWNAPSSWSPDGHRIAVDAQRPGTGVDMFLLSPADNKLAPLFRTDSNEHRGVFSPDGRWLAYVSDESGRDEVYLRPYPGTGEKVQVSNDGGDEPLWARNGREVFYRDGDKLMSIAVTFTGGISVAPPRLLLEQRSMLAGTYGPKNYDVAADGRFVMVKRKNDVSPTEIHVILNWPEELKRLVPSGKK